MSATGKCLCGAVKFTAENPDPHVHACHCSMCRGWTGSLMMAATVESVQFEGEAHVKRYASSDWAARGFCDQCGTSLFYYVNDPGTYIMATGCFDDTEQFQLAGEIYIDEKPSGYNFAGDHDRLTGAECLANIRAPPPE